MATELNDDRRELIETAADDAGMTVEVEPDGRHWCLRGPTDSIHRFLVRIAARNSMFAELLVDCIETGPWAGSERTWDFPAYEWGVLPEDDEDDWAEVDEDTDPDSKETDQT
jgi:hypothetical protein